MGYDDDENVLEEMESEAADLYAKGDYDAALAEFSVLREVRARRDGPYSKNYLTDLLGSVRCMGQLERWGDLEPISAEFYNKYLRTHPAADAISVEAARWLAWAKSHTGQGSAAADLYVRAADALVKAGDETGALPLLRAGLGQLRSLAESDPIAALLERISALPGSSRLAELATALQSDGSDDEVSSPGATATPPRP